MLIWRFTVKSDRIRENDYEDMINLPHHISANHLPMPVEDRAAQFAPFSALTGYEDAVRETGRMTCERKELEEDAKDILDSKLQMMRKRSGERLPVFVTYFRPDTKKEGGEYVTVTGYVKTVDLYRRRLVVEDDTANLLEIDLDEISELEGEYLW